MTPAVSYREYARLLGYPKSKPLEGDVLVRAEEAIEWYRRNGRPTVTVRKMGEEAVAALSAGVEVADEIARLWASDRVDEAYFLDRLAAVVVESLAVELGDELGAGDHRSPGYEGFPLEDQHALFSLLAPLSPPIEILPSGMLKPQHSMLAVYSLGGEGRGEGRRGSPCARCGLVSCGFRGKVA
jgi:hypothetical protein